jgi:hypothetical protein
MPKLPRAVVLAAMHLAGLVAVAQAHPSNDPASARHAALGRVGFLATTADATLRGLLAQERDYSTWDYGDTSAPAPDEPSGQPGWLVASFGVLSAVLALVAGVAVTAARRAGRSQRAGQTA